jgi:hypothetical protein
MDLINRNYGRKAKLKPCTMVLNVALATYYWQINVHREVMLEIYDVNMGFELRATSSADM